MSDRGRGRATRPDFGARPLGRMQDFSGRGGLSSRTPSIGNRRKYHQCHNTMSGSAFGILPEADQKF